MNMLHPRLKRLIKNNHDHIQAVEQDYLGYWWLYLHPGWCIGCPGIHAISCEFVDELCDKFCYEVDSCGCSTCRADAVVRAQQDLFI